MKTVAIIQARMGSTRLPGKVLMDLGGMTVLARVVHRAKQCRRLDEVVVATTDREQDRAIVEETQRCGATVFRGSETDVLDRYFQATVYARADVVVRITSDCPLLDPGLLERMLLRFHTLLRHGYPADYLSNTQTRTYPRGLDIEIFTQAALTRAHREARDPFEREHVTPYFYRNPQSFALVEERNRVDWSGYRWTLDTPEDFCFLQQLVTALEERGDALTTEAAVLLLEERPELAAINRHVRQAA